MSRRLVESLKGVGAIHAGDVLLRTTHYDLSVWSEDGAPGEGAASIEGHIDITGIGETVVLAGPESLTLTIEDGRRLAFRLTSTGGQIVASSWLP
jgi:hypothetical protein